VTIGLDVGDRNTHVCVLDASRAVVARFDFATTASQLTQALDGFPGARLVIEAGSQSPWMSRHLRDQGFEVHVADPRRVQLLAQDPRKTDRRDAETLARMEAGMPELLGAVHHRGLQAHADLAIVRARDLVVRMRTKAIQCIRGMSKAFGVRLPAASSRGFTKRAHDGLPIELKPAIEPLFAQIDQLSETIRNYEHRMDAVVHERYAAEVALLRQVNGVGRITATAFVLTLETPDRFATSRQVGSWLGLCPRSHASGDADPRLPISKAGDGALRRLLVQCAQYILGPFGQESDLRNFGLALVARGGRAAKRKAVTAVARKLAVLLHSLWKHRSTYEPLRQTARRATTVA
jgi:transposase